MWYNPIIKWLLISPFHPFVSKNMMLLTYYGRKSGTKYTTPVNYFPARDEEGNYYATTSVRERFWWRNLRGGLGVMVRIRGRDLPAHAQVFEDEASVAEGMAQILRETPEIARYFQVEMDDSGQPNREQIFRNALGKVLVKTRLVGPGDVRWMTEDDGGKPENDPTR